MNSNVSNTDMIDTRRIEQAECADNSRIQET